MMQISYPQRDCRGGHIDNQYRSHSRHVQHLLIWHFVTAVLYVVVIVLTMQTPQLQITTQPFELTVPM